MYAPKLTGIFASPVEAPQASRRSFLKIASGASAGLVIGMALPVTINLPFSQIDGASLRLFANGSGDIPLKVTAKERIAYLMLWPHARPFHFAHPQPTLRCVARADDVAGLLAAALAGAIPQPLQAEAVSNRAASNSQPVAA